MDDKIYNKVITIESKEEIKTSNGNTMVKITDHTGEKFGFFKKKKDGSLGAPAVQFRDMGLDEGSTVKIGYVIETYQDKNGVTRESHKIINFQETSDSPTQDSQTEEKPRGEAPARSQANSSRDFDKENVGKCQSLFLAAYIQAGHTIVETKLQVIQAKKLAEMVVYGHSETVAPDIQETAEQMADESIPLDPNGMDGIEDIPF
jgi:hypothetical protein